MKNQKCEDCKYWTRNQSDKKGMCQFNPVWVETERIHWCRQFDPWEVRSGISKYDPEGNCSMEVQLKYPTPPPWEQIGIERFIPEFIIFLLQQFEKEGLKLSFDNLERLFGDRSRVMAVLRKKPIKY